MMELIEYLTRWNKNKNQIEVAKKIDASKIEIDFLWKQLKVSKDEALKIMEKEYFDLRIKEHLNIKRDVYLEARSEEIDFFVIRNIIQIKSVNSELGKKIINSEGFGKIRANFKSKYWADYIDKSLK